MSFRIDAEVANFQRGTRSTDGERPRLILLFLALVLVLSGLSPWTMEGMGYSGETERAASQILDRLGGEAVGIDWPRHGLAELLFELPIVAIARASGAMEPATLLCILPIFATALIGTLVAVWLLDLGLRPRTSIILGAGSVLGTFLLPYSAIGLETTQSASLLLLGWLALRRHGEGFGRWAGLAVLAALATSLKNSGLVLLPPVALALAVAIARLRRGRLQFLLGGGTVLTTGLLWLGAAKVRELTPLQPYGLGVGEPIAVVDSILRFASFFGSPNKSLFLFAPVCLFAVLRLGLAFRRAQEEALFAVATLGSLAGGFSLLLCWTDETWGPRYLHAAVAPLVVALGASLRGERDGRFSRRWILAGSLLVGLGINLLGSMFYYGAVHLTAMAAGKSTLAALQHDPLWNAPAFNLRLLRIWSKGGSGPEIWTPRERYWWEKGRDWEVGKPVDLRPFARPQPILLRAIESPGGDGRRFSSLAAGAALVGGLGILAALMAGRRAVRGDSRPCRAGD